MGKQRFQRYEGSKGETSRHHGPLYTHSGRPGGEGAQHRLPGTRFTMTACSVKGDTRWQA